MRTKAERREDLYKHAEKLHAAGFRKANINRLIIAYGEFLPVFGQQLDGFYLGYDGEKTRHHLSPGWYQILKVEGKQVWLLKTYVPTAEPFETSTEWLESTIMANDEMLSKGTPGPDDTFDPSHVV